jgi:hypothetical protein
VASAWSAVGTTGCDDGFGTSTGTTWGQQKIVEHEVAIPGSLTWDDVFGFRQISTERKLFIEPIYLRPGFQRVNPNSYRKVHQVLSCKRQG